MSLNDTYPGGKAISFCLKRKGGTKELFEMCSGPCDSYAGSSGLIGVDSLDSSLKNLGVASNVLPISEILLSLFSSEMDETDDKGLDDPLLPTAEAKDRLSMAS